MKNVHELPSSSMFSDRGLFVFLQTERNAGDFTTFYHCWRLSGDSTEMLASPAECGRLDNYELGREKCEKFAIRSYNFSNDCSTGSADRIIKSSSK